MAKNTEEVKFLGADIISSTKYKPFRDILTALLDKKTMYSEEEIKKIIEKFNRVKA